MNRYTSAKVFVFSAMKCCGFLILFLLLQPLTLMGQVTLEDKIYGMLIGSAIGDAGRRIHHRTRRQNALPETPAHRSRTIAA